jgi:hypothetical protein
LENQLNEQGDYGIVDELEEEIAPSVEKDKAEPEIKEKKE